MSATFRCLRRLYAPGLALLLASNGMTVVGLAAEVAAKTEQARSLDAAAEKALQGALAGTPEGFGALHDWLAEAKGQPKPTADRAVDLIQALRSAVQDNPGLMQQAADRIAQAAERLLKQVHIVKTAVASDVVLGQGRLGFVLQPADAAAPAGFEVLLPRDPRLRGNNLKGIRASSRAPILQAGIVGVESVTLTVPNGKYRVILLTDDMGVANLNRSPFGRVVKVNEQSFDVVVAPPSEWVSHAVIGQGNEAVATGGALVLPADVTAGRLVLQFQNPVGETFISGLILEPLAQRSLVAGVDVAGDEQAIADAAAEIDDAVGALLADFPTAAGPQQTATQLGLTNPPAPADTVSAN